MSNLIFIGGVHGVGKTQLSSDLERQLKLETYSASKLISDIKKIRFAKNKRVKNIRDNQEILLYAINQLDIRSKFFILEGHFCLINEEGEITRIPENSFRKLNPKGIIVKIDDVEKISDRLSRRDMEQFDIAFLKSFQEEEIDYAKEISQGLGIPYLIYSAESSISSIRKFIESLKT
ncbi:AAA family ATPase [Cohnella endophytica]|uniref:AAA family ATPase n=1 Tax=Cohnella endophytica TaxID=2419778 RepID=A0A494XAR8_9BACL|nr:AAA family ATPase [Cohnella endophytica]RKP47855.1 AAA family ATPase [Cohnella endophytica]